MRNSARLVRESCTSLHTSYHDVLRSSHDDDEFNFCLSRVVDVVWDSENSITVRSALCGDLIRNSNFSFLRLSDFLFHFSSLYGQQFILQFFDASNEHEIQLFSLCVLFDDIIRVGWMAIKKWKTMAFNFVNLSDTSLSHSWGQFFVFISVMHSLEFVLLFVDFTREWIISYVHQTLVSVVKNRNKKVLRNSFLMSFSLPATSTWKRFK